ARSRCPLLLAPPEGIRQQGPAIVLHDVDLAAVGPLARDAEGPEHGPEARAGIDPRPHLEPAVAPLVQPLGRQTRRGIVGVGPALRPLSGGGVVVWIGDPLAAGRDHEAPVLAGR